MNGNLQSKVKGVVQADNIALVSTEWSFSGTGSNGKPVSLGGKASDVLRQQSDGAWHILIDNPWGTDLSFIIN
jgi:ketosteroid isomerase-like protein